MTSQPNKPIVVQKFGGSSVGDVDRLKHVAKLIQQTFHKGFRVCVVVSAMGKTTDALLAQAHQFSPHPPRRELDMLLSTGERASAAFLCMALHDLGVPALSLTGSQAGIITNHSHAGARIVEVRPYRVQDALAEDRVVVVAGFQGMSYQREITTLGRGGSDTTAVALAAALDATCEIYSDIDGVYSADPRIVPNAVRLEHLSYEEMQELAEAGATVLNAQAVQFAKAKEIAIFARRTGDSEFTGTEVRKNPPRQIGSIRGIAHRTSMHTILSPKVDDVGFILTSLKEHHIPSGHIVAFSNSTMQNMQGGVHILVPPEDAWGLDDCIRTMQTTHPTVHKGNPVGVVSAVGHGVLDNRDIVGSIFDLLKQHRITILGLTTSSFRISLLLPPDDTVEKTVNILHSHFIEHTT